MCVYIPMCICVYTYKRVLHSSNLRCVCESFIRNRDGSCDIRTGAFQSGQEDPKSGWQPRVREQSSNLRVGDPIRGRRLRDRGGSFEIGTRASKSGREPPISGQEFRNGYGGLRNRYGTFEVVRAAPNSGRELGNRQTSSDLGTEALKFRHEC